MRRLAGVAQDELRRHNLSALLTHVHVHGPTARAVLTSELRLNRSTIGALTGDLVVAGLVREELPADRGRAGRPSLVVYPEADRAYVLAIDLGVDYTTAGRIGLGGGVLDRRHVHRGRGDYPADQAVGELTALAEELLCGHRDRCVGIGVAVAGLVRESDGLVRFGPNLGWADVPLGGLLAAALDLPVTVANDADLGALAEHVRGAGYANTIYLAGEIGVGGGIISDGHPLRGRGGYAGEIGHMTVNPGGRLCRCGARGCWETEIGEAALLAAAALPDAEFADVARAAADGDATARAALRTVGGWLAVGVGNLVNIFNPDAVIFGGLLRDLLPLVADQIRATLHEGGLVAPREGVRLLRPALGPDSSLIGAAELAFRPLLADPLGRIRQVRPS